MRQQLRTAHAQTQLARRHEAGLRLAKAYSPHILRRQAQAGATADAALGFKQVWTVQACGQRRLQQWGKGVGVSERK